MRVEDLWRIFPTQKSHVAKLLESKSLLCDFLYCVEVEGLAWRRVGYRNKGTALKPVWEVVDDPGEEVATKVMANGMDFVQFFVVEDLNHLYGHLLAFVVGGRGGFVGATIAEEVGDEDTIA